MGKETEVVTKIKPRKFTSRGITERAKLNKYRKI
jgi:hypothetical protein